MNDLMNQTILADVKASIGLNPDEVDEDFDRQIVSAINVAISELAQLGYRTLGEFFVSSDETWTDYIGEDEKLFPFVKNYVEVKTRMLFDPPQNGSLMSAMENLLDKATFNIQTAIELG